MPEINASSHHTHTHTRTNGTMMRYNDKHVVNLLHVSALFVNFQGGVQQRISKQSVTNPSNTTTFIFLLKHDQHMFRLHRPSSGHYFKNFQNKVKILVQCNYNSHFVIPHVTTVVIMYNYIKLHKVIEDLWCPSRWL
jgi:hypothetical protein